MLIVDYFHKYGLFIELLQCLGIRHVIFSFLKEMRIAISEPEMHLRPKQLNLGARGVTNGRTKPHERFESYCQLELRDITKGYDGLGHLSLLVSCR